MSKIKVTIPCNEANHVCDKTQYKESTLWEKIKLNLHLIYCRACRKYSNANSKLSEALKTSEVECLDPECKEKMKKEFNEALSEHKQ